METLKKFLIEYIGIKMSGDFQKIETVQLSPTFKRFEKYFPNRDAALKYAEESMEGYLPKKLYFRRYWEVVEFDHLSDGNNEVEQLHERVLFELEEYLHPAVDHYCSTFWMNTRMVDFMNTVLKQLDSSNGEVSTRKKIRYITDLFMKDKQAELGRFHRRFKDDFIRAQVENRVALFLDNPESVINARAIEDIMTPV